MVLKLIRKRSGFTLIELLIVLAILGVLLSFLGGNYLQVKRKSRDAQRKEDFKQIQSALEMYYNDHGCYPAVGEFSFGSPWEDTVSGALYMAQVPQDKKEGYVYFYQIDPGGNGILYELYARLENNQDPDYQEYLGISCGAAVCTYRAASPNVKKS